MNLCSWVKYAARSSPNRLVPPLSLHEHPRLVLAHIPSYLGWLRFLVGQGGVNQGMVFLDHSLGKMEKGAPLDCKSLGIRVPQPI